MLYEDETYSMCSPRPPSILGGSGKGHVAVKGHFGVKSQLRMESSTKVTRGHFKVTAIYLNPQHQSRYNLHHVQPGPLVNQVKSGDR